jgi:hypothetical protein
MLDDSQIYDPKYTEQLNPAFQTTINAPDISLDGESSDSNAE